LEVLDLSCSGCGKESDEMAGFRSGEIVMLLCKVCLLDAVAMIENQERPRKDTGQSN